MKKFITGWTRFFRLIEVLFFSFFLSPRVKLCDPKKKNEQKKHYKPNRTIGNSIINGANVQRIACDGSLQQLWAQHFQWVNAVRRSRASFYFISSSHCLTWFQFIVCYASALDENPNNYKFSIHFNHCRRRWRPTHEHVWVYMICIRQMEYYAKRL